MASMLDHGIFINKNHVSILCIGFLTLGFGILLRFDHIESVDYQSLSCHKCDESQMTHICNEQNKRIELITYYILSFKHGFCRKGMLICSLTDSKTRVHKMLLRLRREKLVRRNGWIYVYIKSDIITTPIYFASTLFKKIIITIIINAFLNTSENKISYLFQLS